MSSKSKTIKQKHSFEFIFIVIAFCASDQSYDKINQSINLFRSIVIIIIHRINKIFNVSFVKQKRIDRLIILNTRAKRIFIRHVERNSQNNLLIFVIFFKSNYKLSRFIVRKILKTKNYFRFKIKKKSFFIERHKKIKLQ